MRRTRAAGAGEGHRWSQRVGIAQLRTRRAQSEAGCARTDSESTRCGTRMFRYLWCYGIEHYHELMHALFLLEDRFGIEPCVDGSIRFTNEAIQSCVCTWRSWKEFLEEGKITREEYEDKKDGLVG